MTFPLTVCGVRSRIGGVEYTFIHDANGNTVALIPFDKRRPHDYHDALRLVKAANIGFHSGEVPNAD